LEAPSTWLYRKDRRLDRWYLGGRSKWARNGLEALGTDVCHEAPPGARGMHHDAVEVQKYLRTSIRAGEAVELRLLHQLPAGEEQSPPYAVLHEERQVGQVSEQFRRDLCRLLRRGGVALDRPWPALITGLRVDGVESVAAPPPPRSAPASATTVFGWPSASAAWALRLEHGRRHKRH